MIRWTRTSWTLMTFLDAIGKYSDFWEAALVSETAEGP